MYRYRIVYEDNSAHEVDANSMWIAMIKSGAIMRDDQIVSIRREEMPREEYITNEGRHGKLLDLLKPVPAL